MIDQFIAWFSALQWYFELPILRALAGAVYWFCMLKFIIRFGLDETALWLLLCMVLGPFAFVTQLEPKK